MGLMGMWDLEKVLTLEMLMVSAFSVCGGGHHFRIQNVPVSKMTWTWVRVLSRDLLTRPAIYLSLDLADNRQDVGDGREERKPLQVSVHVVFDEFYTKIDT